MLTIHIQTLIARPALMRQFNVRFADSVLLPLLPLSGKASDWSLLSQALAKVGNLAFSNQKKIPSQMCRKLVLQEHLSVPITEMFQGWHFQI